jgi:DNA-binding transcriptional regulator YhcF (GntR family)
MILCTIRISTILRGSTYQLRNAQVNVQLSGQTLWPYGQWATRSSGPLALPTMTRRSIDLYSGEPLYRQLADILRGVIQRGEWRPGVTLPTLQRLAADYELGVDAVRDALAVLRGEGLIETERGKPARVRARQQPAVVKVPPGAHVTTRMPTEEERRRFGLSEGTPLLVIKRDGQMELLPGDKYAVETVESEAD